MSILVEDGRIAWIRPSDDEGPVADPGGLEVVDASGSTIVPGMVDAHSHLTMPGGAHWIDRATDPIETLLEVAEDNARLLTRAGVRWARDVGSVTRPDPEHEGAPVPSRSGSGSSGAGAPATRTFALPGRGSWPAASSRPCPWRPRTRTSCSPPRRPSWTTAQTS